MIINGRVPVRISFGGGGTDTSPYCDENEGVALNATINKYIYASLKPRVDSKIIVSVENKEETFYSIEDIEISGDLSIPNAIIKNYWRDPKGLELRMHSEVPISSGVGGSASAFVLLISLFNNFNKSISKDQYEIAEEALRFEREELKIHGGKQDQYAATFGGLNYIEFNPQGFVKVNKLKLNRDLLMQLESNLLLFYIGPREQSGDIIEEQSKNVQTKEESLQAMHETKRLAKEMKQLLIRGELNEFGKKVHEAWEQKKKFSSNVSSKHIDNIYNSFTELGALGGKITGAGGGGHMIFYAPMQTHPKILEKAKSLGIQNVPFNFTDEGVELWISEENQH